MPENIKEQDINEQFDKYYETKILPKLLSAEKNRKKLISLFFLVLFIVLAWCFFTFLRLKNPNSIFQNTLFYVDIISCFSILLLCWPMFSYYQKSKENLLPLIAGFFGDFTYTYQKEFPKTLLQYSKIIPQNDKIKTDDCFEGEYENIPVSITEYVLYKTKLVHENNSKYERNIKISQGVLFRAQMNKKFQGQTIVVKDKGFRNNFVRYENLKRVKLESPVFEKAYEVYSDNQIEARYILTTVMLEYMLEVKKIFPNITFSFFDNEVLINIETNKNLFECTNFFCSILNKKRIKQIYKELHYLFNIIKTLRLNQKNIL